MTRQTTPTTTRARAERPLRSYKSRGARGQLMLNVRAPSQPSARDTRPAVNLPNLPRRLLKHPSTLSAHDSVAVKIPPALHIGLKCKRVIDERRIGSGNNKRDRDTCHKLALTDITLQRYIECLSAFHPTTRVHSNI